MAKKTLAESHSGIYPYPSQFGSHAKMIETAETEKLENDLYVMCRDEYGLYVTEKKRLDDGMSDPYRCLLPEDRTKMFHKICGGQIFNIVS